LTKPNKASRPRSSAATNGGWAVFVWSPTAEVRVEAASNLTSTVSFFGVEILR
jgi:hypothetical protein